MNEWMLLVDRPPSVPLYLRYSFVITNSDITVQLSWQPPTSGDVTGYRVTCARAGSSGYTDRRTLVSTTLPSVSVVCGSLSAFNLCVYLLYFIACLLVYV